MRSRLFPTTDSPQDGCEVALQAAAFRADLEDAPEGADGLVGMTGGEQRAAEALVAFESVMGAQPDNAELFNNRGVALWLLKRPAEALASFERTLAIEAHFAEAWGNRGLALRDLARWLYRQLEAEYDHLTSDETIEEGIIVNEYTFTESGRRFG
mgnify:CR=1 FL=1